MNDVIEIESTVEDIEQPDVTDVQKVKEHQALIVAQFGDGKEYNKERVEEEIKVQSDNVRRSFFEIGKKLILLKEHEPHGSFTESLNYLDISPRTARELMSVARKFIGENGAPKTATIAVLPPTKLYALARLDDDDLSDLEEKGKIEGLTIKEVEEMTSRELKERVKELKAENSRLKQNAQRDKESDEALLAEKSKKLDDMERQLRAVTDQSRWGERAEGYLNKMHSIMANTNRIVSELAEILSGIQEMDVKEWEASQDILIQQAKFVVGDLYDRVQVLDRRADELSPGVNAAYRELHDLRLAIDAGGPDRV